jgi:DNA polymerase III subunit delta
MKLSAGQIGSAKKLFPVYLVCGDEPLQYAEAVDSIRAACRTAGYSNREVFDVEAGFRWDVFEIAARSRSLFSEKRLLELRFGQDLPDQPAAARLVDYLQRVAADTVLLVTCGKLAKATAKSTWFQTVERAGAVIQVRPLERSRFLSWLEARTKARGVVLAPPALQLLASRVEGNMLAAAQEIEKLYVLHGAEPLDAATVGDTVADSAHYDVFHLVDSALAGQPARSYRILSSLRSEAIAPQIVLWAFTRELRTLAKMRFDLERGEARASVFSTYRIWETRRPLIDAALRRFGVTQIQEFIRRCASIDLVGKGLAPGDVWDDLLLLSMSIAGPGSILSAKKSERYRIE